MLVTEALLLMVPIIQDVMNMELGQSFLYVTVSGVILANYSFADAALQTQKKVSMILKYKCIGSSHVYVAESTFRKRKISVFQKEISFLLKLPSPAQSETLPRLKRKYTAQSETAQRIRA